MNKKKIISSIVIFSLFFLMFISIGESTIFQISSIETLENETFYVGGTGPNNYSSIQDAIDNADDWDLIYVYDDSSPYYESLFIDKRISIFGEERDSTVIIGNESGYVINVIDTSLYIKDISVKNGYRGICQYSSDDDRNVFFVMDNCDISDNELGLKISMTEEIIIRNSIFQNNSRGGCSITDYCTKATIFNCTFLYNKEIYYDKALHYDCKYFGDLEIYDCRFENNTVGISLSTNKANIYNNIIKNNMDGILIHWSFGNFLMPFRKILIQNNLFENNGDGGDFQSGGIIIQDTMRCVLIQNNIFQNNNGVGVYCLRSMLNTIVQNNFINNSYNAFLFTSLFQDWDSNYWDDWGGEGPYGIMGYFSLFFEYYNYDYNPAKEPYDIGI